MKTRFFFLAALTIARCAYAQEATPTPTVAPRRPPSGPLLKPVPDNTRWTITTTPGAAGTAKPEATATPGKKSRSGKKGGTKSVQPMDSPKPDAKPQTATTVTGEKMGKLIHVLSVAANGAKVEKWTDGKLTAILTGESPEPSYATTPIEGVPMPSWISRKNYVETRSEDQHTLFFFRDRILPTTVEQFQDYEHPGQNDREKFKVDATATIDADTSLPVIVTEGTTATVYKFERLEPGAEILPAAILSALDDREQKLQNAVRAPERP